MQHPFLFTILAVLFTFLRAKCYINVNLVHGDYFACKTYCIYEIYYYLCDVKRTTTKETNEKKKTKMTTIEKLQQLGAGQYIDFTIEGTDSALECYLCSDRHADAIKSIRILNDGCGMILEVQMGEIMMHKATTVYITIEDKEIMDIVEASEIKMQNVEVLYSSNVEDDKEATAEEEIEVVEITTTWHKATDKIAMTYAQIKYIDALATDGNIEGWDFPSNTNAQRSLTKYDASEIIDALKSGKKVVIK